MKSARVLRTVLSGSQSCKSSGLPSVRHRCYHSSVVSSQALEKQRIGVIGALFEKGQINAGVADGPSAIRKTGFITRLVELGHDVLDYGDVRDDPSIAYTTGPDGEKDFDRVLKFSERLAQNVLKIKNDNRICVTLGGDHTTAIGSLSGHCMAARSQNKKVSVLWVDAHADINTGETSASGNMHGMSLAFLLRSLSHNTLQSGFPQSCIEDDQVAHIGLRDVEDKEFDHLKKLGIPAYHMQDVDRLGIHEVIARCLDHLKPGPDRVLHVSFDIDSLDPIYAPSTGTPVHGGLTVREGCAVMEAARATGYLSGLDLVEVNPSLTDQRLATQTASVAKTILTVALGGHTGI